MSAENAKYSLLADVTVKVFDARRTLASFSVRFLLSVYEGSEDVLFDCSASGAPGANPDYTYSWRTRGDTPQGLLSGVNISSPTFAVPDAVDEDETYEYTLTVSAANAEDATLDVAITVLNRRALSVVCADPPSVYEGSADLVGLLGFGRSCGFRLRICMDGEGEYIGHIAFERHGSGLADVLCTG